MDKCDLKDELPGICLHLKKQIQVFSPMNFTYSKLLGEGAFGKVRKCDYTENSLPLERVK